MTHKINASESRARNLFPYLVGGDGVYHPVTQPSSPRVFVVPVTRCTYSHTRIRPWRNISVVMLSFRQRKRRGRLVCTKSTPLLQRPGVLQSGLKRARSPTSIHCSGKRIRYAHHQHRSLTWASGFPWTYRWKSRPIGRNRRYPVRLELPLCRPKYSCTRARTEGSDEPTIYLHTHCTVDDLTARAEHYRRREEK